MFRKSVYYKENHFAERKNNEFGRAEGGWKGGREGGRKKR
jgi:hypothetical protein